MDLVYMHGARCVMISDLARFPMHRTDWCIRVNRHLRQVYYNAVRYAVLSGHALPELGYDGR